MRRTDFLHVQPSIPLMLISAFLLVGYVAVITFWFHISNWWLFVMLIIGQLYFLLLGLTYVHSIWRVPKTSSRIDKDFRPSVDVFITVCGEPIELIEKTLRGALADRYEKKNIYILNDGKVAQTDNWRAVEVLAEKLGVTCITRDIPGGAKAGNINHALSLTDGEIVIVLDADHVPKPALIQTLISPFKEQKMGFVQAPQYYYNQKRNRVTAASWAQQSLFFGVINQGRSRFYGNTMCGTNMAIRRSTLKEVGGMDEENIAEDFLTGMKIHGLGYKSQYIPKILAEGLAPEDFCSYYRQQLRWAKGNLEVLFRYNPLLFPGLTLAQRISYFSSALYYLLGLVVFLNALLPLIYLFTGAVPFLTDTMVLAAAFLPFIFFTLYNLQHSSNFTYTYQGIAYSIGTFPITLQALFETILGKKRSFAVTSKVDLAGNYPSLVIFQMTYIILVVVGVSYNLLVNGLSPALITNTVWASFYVVCFSTVSFAAMPDLARYVVYIGKKTFPIKTTNLFNHRKRA